MTSQRTQIMTFKTFLGPISRTDLSLASYHFVLDLSQKQSLCEIGPGENKSEPCWFVPTHSQMYSCDVVNMFKSTVFLCNTLCLRLSVTFCILLSEIKPLRTIQQLKCEQFHNALQCEL